MSLRRTPKSDPNRIPIPTPMVRRLSASLRRFHVGLDEFHDRVLAAIVQRQGDWAALERLMLDDLVLAYACSRGEKAALGAFEDQCGGEFLAVSTKLRLDEARRTDMRQALWQRLFVGSDSAPKILEYRGIGPLKNWFRVTASRFLLNELRRGRRERLVLEPDHGKLRLATERDPEFLLLEQVHRQQFQAAFRIALQQLRPDQRTSLRCHYILGMTIDQMAEVFGTHRATAARRIAQSRAALLRLTKQCLRQDLGADTDELNSVIRHAQTQSSFSVARLLNETDRTDDAGQHEILPIHEPGLAP